MPHHGRHVNDGGHCPYGCYVHHCYHYCHSNDGSLSHNDNDGRHGHDGCIGHDGCPDLDDCHGNGWVYLGCLEFEEYTISEFKKLTEDDQYMEIEKKGSKCEANVGT